MKKILSVASALVVLVAALSLFVFPSAAEPGGLTEYDAKQLILRAFDFYYRYQFGEEKTVINKDGISAQAREIYADGIADDMWMKRCYGSKNRQLYKDLCDSLDRLRTGEQKTAPGYYTVALDYYQNQIDRLFGNNGLTYVDNGDGTVTILPFASDIMDWRKFEDAYYGVNVNSQNRFWQIVISKEYSSDYFSEKIRPSVPDDIEIRSLQSDGEGASCDVLIYAHVTPEPNAGGVTDYRPVWVGVEFSMTGGGWRICGGDIVSALSDWSEIAGKDLPSDVSAQHRGVFCPADEFESDAAVSRSDHLLDAVPRTLIAPELLEPDASYVTSPADVWYLNGNYMATNAGGFRFVSQSGNRAVYEVECISWTSEFGVNFIGETDQFYLVYGKNYGTHTAEFTYDPEYTYTYVHYPDHPFVGAWRLTGGEWYDMLVAANDNLSNRAAILDLFRAMQTRACRYVTGRYYPEYIVGPLERRTDMTFAETDHNILYGMASMGYIYVCPVLDINAFLDYYREVFSDELVDRAFPGGGSVFSMIPGVFGYDGGYYILPYSGSTQGLMFGHDSDSAVAFRTKDYPDAVPYESLEISGNEAVMTVKVWDLNTREYIGVYDVRFTKNDSGWRVSGGTLATVAALELEPDYDHPASWRYRPAPETGDAVTAYGIAASLSALIAAGVLSYGKKKKRARAGADL